MKKDTAVRPVLRISFGERTFDVVGLMASEVAKIQQWTGLASKADWMRALTQEDNDAYRAAYTLMCQRAGEEARFSDADYNTDELDVDWIEPASGRPIEPLIERDSDGEPVLDKDGDPIPIKEQGEVVWVFVDDQSKVPPPNAA